MGGVRHVERQSNLLVEASMDPSRCRSRRALAERLSRPIRLVLLSSCVVGAACSVAEEAASRTTLAQLHVEYSSTPLGIDVEKPRFGWQMRAPEGKRGFSQSAYQIVVTDPDAAVTWDSGKVVSGVSLAIPYAGAPLRSSVRYAWSVTAWDQNGDEASESSWFETGLMSPDPDLAGWDGATWIGGGDDDLVLYAHYLSIFDLEYTVEIQEGSSRAGFVFGANDMRLMDKNKNIYQLENARDESYIKLELDVSGVDGTEDGKARLNVYRVGYKDSDSADVPLETFAVLPSVIDEDNKHAAHHVEITSLFGEISIALDGNSSFAERKDPPTAPGPRFRRGPGGPSVNLNPMGRGGNYITFGMLCDIGFSLEAGQQASFSNVVVSNNRAPNSTLFSEGLTGSYEGIYAAAARGAGSALSVDDGRYRLDGGADGVLLVADPSRNSTPMLRTEFDAGKKAIADARLYVTARGIYEMYLNGARVGEDRYNPGLTQYNKTHMYQTYDVTDMVHSGANAMGAMLGEGWWSGLLSFGSIWNHFGDRQSLLARLVVRYEDGSTDVVTSHPREWKYFSNGPLRYSSLTLGEVYDATRDAAIEGWSTAGYDDRAWTTAQEVSLVGTALTGTTTDFRGRTTSFDYDGMSLIGQIGNSAGVFRTLTARSVDEVRDGVYVYDMGQNIVGVPRIMFEDGTAGQRVVLRVAEMLYPDLEESGNNVGMIMTENYRAALSQDVYIMKDGDQVFQPRFTSHGYQYLEITGIDEPLPLEAVQGVVLSSVLDLAADYETSNPKVNQIWSNLVWSNVDNFLSIPTDCPQRNERMGWSGDISVFARSATYVSDADQFLARHMYAMRDVQTDAGRFTDIAPVGGGFGGVLWGSAGITVPWEAYEQYGDVRLLEEHYEAMAAYVDYLTTTIGDDGLSSDNALGDWLGPQNNQLGTDFLVTAYHVYDLWIMAKTAELLGKDADANKYWQMHGERREFFNKTFVNDEGRTLGIVGRRRGFGGRPPTPGEWQVADTQTSYAVGLALGAFGDDKVPRMATRLAETVERQNADDDGVTRPRHSLMTGFIGTAWISKALSDAGRNDLAYRILQNDQYPSWLYAIDQGATTIWERLNGYTVEDGFGGNNSMNSFNHYSFGAVGQWMMAYSLGIQRGEPGFQRFVLQPQPDPTGTMTWAKGHYDSVYGTIESAWKVEGGRLSYAATVPANTTATLHLPAGSRDAVTEGGQPAAQADGVELVGYEAGKAVFELQSGRYEFETDRPR
jgi:alpha-L-rhamnosidase